MKSPQCDNLSYRFSLNLVQCWWKIVVIVVLSDKYIAFQVAFHNKSRPLTSFSSDMVKKKYSDIGITEIKMYWHDSLISSEYLLNLTPESATNN